MISGRIEVCYRILESIKINGSTNINELAMQCFKNSKANNEDIKAIYEISKMNTRATRVT